MGNQVCCAGTGINNQSDFDHFHQTHIYNRRNKNNLYTYSEQVSHNGPKHLNYDKIVSKNKNNDIHMQNNLLEIYQINNTQNNFDSQKHFQFVQERLRCLLVDKKSLDFSKEISPSQSSLFGVAAVLNKNGFKIQCKPFIVFKNILDFSNQSIQIQLNQIEKKNSLPEFNIEQKDCIKDEKEIQKQDIPQSEQYHQSQQNSNQRSIQKEHTQKEFGIQFVDFSQKRKIGFRDFFEFENKRIMLASDSEIRILGYFQKIDGVQIENAITKKIEIIKSKSPFRSCNQNMSSKQISIMTQNDISNCSEQFKILKSQDEIPKNITMQNLNQKIQCCDKLCSNHIDTQMQNFENEKLSAFELASMKIANYPDEFITYAKFLDDNDPRLILLMTYDQKQTTTYLKVLKIEKVIRPNQIKNQVQNLIGKYKKQRQFQNIEEEEDSSEQIDKDGAESFTSNFEIQGDQKGDVIVRTFSTIENLPIVNLKNEIFQQQQQEIDQNNENFFENAKQLMKNNILSSNENLRGTLKQRKNRDEGADINIYSQGMRNPFKIHTQWRDPQDDFEKIILQQIDEMERLEFNEEIFQRSQDDTKTYIQNNQSKSGSIKIINQQNEQGIKMIQENSQNNSRSDIKIIEHQNQSKLTNLQQYKLVSSKLAKFKNTKLQIVQFGPANQQQTINQQLIMPGGASQTSRSKMMISVDQSGVYRLHKIKAIKLMADKNFLLMNEDFKENEDPFKIINMKNATYNQLRAVQIINDYVFCTLLTSARISFLDPTKIRDMGAICFPNEINLKNTQKVTVQLVIHYQGLIICSILISPNNNAENKCFKEKIIIKQFPIIGPAASSQVSDIILKSLYESPFLDLNQKYFIFSKKHLTNISHIQIPRLNWDDRSIDYYIALEKFKLQHSQEQESSCSKFNSPNKNIMSIENQFKIANLNEQNNIQHVKSALPKKIIICGQYKDLNDEKNYFGRVYPFVALVDTQSMDLDINKPIDQDYTMIKCLQNSDANVTSLNYGPFDNGHIILGFNTGHILILSSIDLASIYRTQIFKCPNSPVSQIIFDPLQKIIAVSDKIFRQQNYIDKQNDKQQQEQKADDTFLNDRLKNEQFSYCPLMYGISLIEKNADYKYIEMAPKTYMTLVIPEKKSRSLSKGKPQSLGRKNQGTLTGCFGGQQLC